MSLHTRLVTSAGDLDPTVVRQIIHELLSGTLSDDDLQILQPDVYGQHLSLESISGSIDLFDYAVEYGSLISGFYGRSRTSGTDSWEALNFGFSQWYMLRTYATDEKEGEYIDPGNDLEKFFRDRQRDWIREGNWSSLALTEFSADDLGEPWFLRELAENNDLLGGNEVYTDSRIGHGDEIPEELIDSATSHWECAVRTDPDDGPVAFGYWVPESPEFDAWVSAHIPYWLDTNQPLSKADAGLLRTACLRLGLLENGQYAL